MTFPVNVPLLASIIMHPDEDTPRVMYADWLEEQGEPDRAEFIRVQCRIAAITAELRDDDSPADLGHECGIPDCPCAERAELRRRERGLWDAGQWKALAVGFEWDYALPGRGSPHLGDTGRGFVESLTCTAEQWLAHADTLHWHASQTVEVPDPHLCAGTITVPRPCPATAQPLRHVTLTTLPGARVLRGLVFNTKERRRRLLPRGMGRHNAAWLAFWDNPEWPRALAAAWPSVRHWNLPGIVSPARD